MTGQARERTERPLARESTCKDTLKGDKGYQHVDVRNNPYTPGDAGLAAAKQGKKRKLRIMTDAT